MNKKILLLIILLIITMSAVGVGLYLYYQNQKETPSPTLQQQDTTNQKPKDVKEVEVADFIPLKSPPSPPFIKSLNIAKDVKIDFLYEGDNPISHWPEYGFYIPEGSNEKFLSLSQKKIEKERYFYGSEDYEEMGYLYGPEYYSVFNGIESHWYGGTPVYLLNQKSKYSVSYVGFQINNRDLISELRIEFGIDYLSPPGGINKSKSKSSIFASIFNIKPVYACGPGIYLRLVGNSNLIFVEESNGIAWYRLEKPIALYNLRLSYCDVDCSLMPSYCPEWGGGPPECEGYECCPWNAEISSLANGNLKMHIFYKPNDKEGFLKLQMVNLILRDSTGAYYQPIMGENFDHYYRAYLHDTGGGACDRGACACLAKGTKITMADNAEKNIEDVKEGDLVKSFNIETKEYKNTKVTQVIKRKDPIVEINNVLKAAPDELIYMENGSTKMAIQLKIGDLLFNGVRVDSIRYSPEKIETYDLILEDANNFFANGYLVRTPE